MHLKFEPATFGVFARQSVLVTSPSEVFLGVPFDVELCDYT